MAININNWSQEDINAVWRKGKMTDDPMNWRVDIYGSLMKYSEYGNRNSKYGWEIDHIVPQSKGGRDDLPNLQPLQWENNVRKGDN